MLGFRLDLPGFESLSCSSVTEGQPMLAGMSMTPTVTIRIPIFWLSRHSL